MPTINEEDLAELERVIPEISDSLMHHLSPRMRTQLRRIKEILSNVRWRYGPPLIVESFPANGHLPGDDDDQNTSSISV